MLRKRHIIPIFIPHKGCPHDCSFCNQKRIAARLEEITFEIVSEKIGKHLSFIPKNPHIIKEIAFYGGSFTGLSREKQTEFLSLAYKYKQAGMVDDIRISTRPDYIDSNILQLLKDYGVSIIELGVQSTNDNVLELNKRGHTKNHVFNAVEQIKAMDFILGLQMMVGLYGDNEKSLMNTGEDLISLKPDFVRIYPTLVIKDTFLEVLYLKGKYVPVPLEETIRLCKILLKKFKEAGIPVIRLGLQTTEEITMGKGVIAGPFHPALCEKVESEIYKDMIIEEIEKKYFNFSKDFGNLTIYCNPKECSKVAGHKQQNKDYLIKKYGFEKVEIKKYDNLKIGEINIKIKNQ